MRLEARSLLIAVMIGAPRCKASDDLWRYLLMIIICRLPWPSEFFKNDIADVCWRRRDLHLVEQRQLGWIEDALFSAEEPQQSRRFFYRVARAGAHAQRSVQPQDTRRRIIRA